MTAAYVSFAGLTTLAWLLTVAFVVVYAVRSPWRSTPVGRLLMSDGLVMVLLLGFNVWGMVVGPLWWPLYLLGLAALNGLAVWRIRLVLRAQRRP